MAGRLASRIGKVSPPRRARRFLHDDRGVTVVEFGLLATPFFAIVGAILETSIVFLSGQILDSAVQDVSRLIRTGQAQQAAMSPDAFKTAVCDRTFGLFSDCTGPGGLHVEVQVIDTFSDVDMTPPVNWTCDEEEDDAACAAWTRPEAYTPGQGSSIVTVQVYYQWPLILSMDWLGLSNLPSGKRLMAAAAAFRNEPFT